MFLWVHHCVCSRHRVCLVGVFAAVLITAVVGCPESTDQGTDDQPVDSQCTADSECHDGEFCLEGLCSIEPGDDQLHYGLIVKPSNRAEIPPQIIAPEQRSIVDAGAVVEMAPPIDGELTTSDGQPAPDGTLVARPLDESTATDVQTPVRSGHFELHVFPAEFELFYIVDDHRWPRIPLGSHPLDDSVDFAEWSIPTFDDLRTVSGELTRNAVELVTPLEEPVEGAQIVAEAPQSGHRSQVAVTDENGEFTLRLPPGDDEFDVRVAPGPDNPIVPRATFSGEIDAGTDDISLSIGDLELELLSAVVEIDPEPVADHTPTWEDFRVDIDRPVDVGQLLLTPRIDDGVAEFDAIPGTYDIEITPAPGSPWAGASDELDILGSLSDVEIHLAARPNVTGELSDADGQPVPNTRVTARPDDSDQPAPPPVYTDEDGSFELWLDPGDYELILRPPAVAGLPRQFEELSVDANDSEQSWSAQLRRGAVATGRVQTRDNRSLAYASIEVFFDDENRRRVVDHGITARDGTFRIIVAPDITGGP